MATSRDRMTPDPFGDLPTEAPGRRYRAIYETSGLPIVIADRERRILDCNDAMERWLGYSRAELRGRTIAEISHPDDEAENVQLARQAEANASSQAFFQMEKRYLCKDGTTVWGALSVTMGRGDDELPDFFVGRIQDITEKKRVEEALRRNEEKLRSIFQAAPAGIGMVVDRVIQEVNDRLCEITGYGRHELIGRSVRLLYPTAEEFEWTGTRKYRQIAEQGSGTAEARWLRKDGAIIHVLLGSTPINANEPSRGVTFTALDITDRKVAEDALRDSEERYRLLFELESDAIFVVDSETGRILEANQASCALFGYDRAELLGMPIGELSDEPEETERVTRRPLTQGEILHVPLRRLCKKDGTVFPVEITGRFFELGGRAVHIAAIRDVSERQRAEEERRRLEEQMRHVQKLESLGVLAGGIAHDFNNLLMAILGNADLALLRLPPQHPSRDNVREIGTAAERAADLCRQMLAYAGKGTFAVENVELSGLVKEMSEILQVSVSKKAVFQYALDPALPPVKADPSQLRQVVMNLITNASDALQGETGVISVATGQRECGVAEFRGSYLGEDLPAGTYVFFAVRDTGCGMDAETRLRIFDPFFSTKFAGRGLGLAAVLGIVRGHGGTITIESRPGAGSEFQILLPAALPEMEKEPGHAGVVLGPTQQGTVLLVDDEEPVRRVTKRMLEALGYRVLLAADGEEAVRVFREHVDEVACVLLDLTMPRMGGEEAFLALREVRPDVPVVLSSGYDQEEVAARFAGRNLTGFIQKPYTVARLRSVLGKEPP